MSICKVSKHNHCQSYSALEDLDSLLYTNDAHIAGKGQHMLTLYVHRKDKNSVFGKLSISCMYIGAHATWGFSRAACA